MNMLEKGDDKMSLTPTEEVVEGEIKVTYRRTYLSIEWNCNVAEEDNVKTLKEVREDTFSIR